MESKNIMAKHLMSKESKFTISEMLNMKYLDIVDMLKNKYGEVSKNYFTQSGSKTIGISRGRSEGLYIHHIDEDKMTSLSTKMDNHPIINRGLLNDEQIKMVRNDFQNKDRLVYCDLLELLLLYLKIVENPKPLIPNLEVGICRATRFIVPELNDIFSGIQYKIAWKKEVTKRVIDRKNEYFELLKFGISKLEISEKIFRTSFVYNSEIWHITNNMTLFEEFNRFLEDKNKSHKVNKINLKNETVDILNLDNYDYLENTYGIEFDGLFFPVGYDSIPYLCEQIKEYIDIYRKGNKNETLDIINDLRDELYDGIKEYEKGLEIEYWEEVYGETVNDYESLKRKRGR